MTPNPNPSPESVLQAIVDATTVGKRGSCATRSKYGSYPSALYHAAVAAISPQTLPAPGEDRSRMIGMASSG